MLPSHLCIASPYGAYRVEPEGRSVELGKAIHVYRGSVDLQRMYLGLSPIQAAGTALMLLRNGSGRPQGLGLFADSGTAGEVAAMDLVRTGMP